MPASPRHSRAAGKRSAVPIPNAHWVVLFNLATAQTEISRVYAIYAHGDIDIEIYIYTGRRNRTLHLYEVTATNLLVFGFSMKGQTLVSVKKI